MFELLYDPISEIKRAKKHGYLRLLLYLLTCSLFLMLGFLFLGWALYSNTFQAATFASIVLGGLFAIIVAPFVLAFFFSIVLHVLGSKSVYYESLTAFVLSMIFPAVFLFFAGSISFFPKLKIISALLISYGSILGIATFFRAAKEYSDLPYVDISIAVLVVLVPLCLVGVFFVL